jgi:hypothetical protein
MQGEEEQGSLRCQPCLCRAMSCSIHFARKWCAPARQAGRLGMRLRRSPLRARLAPPLPSHPARRACAALDIDMPACRAALRPPAAAHADPAGLQRHAQPDCGGGAARWNLRASGALSVAGGGLAGGGTSLYGASGAGGASGPHGTAAAQWAAALGGGWRARLLWGWGRQRGSSGGSGSQRVPAPS